MTHPWVVRHLCWQVWESPLQLAGFLGGARCWLPHLGSLLGNLMAQGLQGPLYVESRSESKNAPLITLFCSPHPPTSWRHRARQRHRERKPMTPGAGLS